MIDINQHKFKAGDIIKPIKGKIFSNGYNIQHVKKCKVTYLSKFTYSKIQILTLEGNIYRNGYNRIDVIVTVNSNDFELYNFIDNYEIF